MQKPMKYSQTDDYNHYCFFQPLSRIQPRLEQQAEFEPEYDLPNPLDRYRAPIPRLVQ